ncbi:MAG: hypothetical protein HKN30_15945 [Sulfitobacter sp.]|nr:hypothetical protein [Sulfitobacter sp.]
MSKNPPHAPDPSGKPLLPQIAILTGTLTIILAGAWYLYMANAPYHPDGQGSETGTFTTD